MMLWLPHQGCGGGGGGGGGVVSIVAGPMTTMASSRQRRAVGARRALVPLAPLLVANLFVLGPFSVVARSSVESNDMLVGSNDGRPEGGLHP